MDEPYENLVAAVALIDAAMEQLEGHEACADLNDIRNDLNRGRLALLGNGQSRPFYVSDLNIT